jgi:hypothetical protein
MSEFLSSLPSGQKSTGESQLIDPQGRGLLCPWVFLNDDCRMAGAIPHKVVRIAATASRVSHNDACAKDAALIRRHDRSDTTHNEAAAPRNQSHFKKFFIDVAQSPSQGRAVHDQKNNTSLARLDPALAWIAEPRWLDNNFPRHVPPSRFLANCRPYTQSPSPRQKLRQTIFAIAKSPKPTHHFQRNGPSKISVKISWKFTDFLSLFAATTYSQLFPPHRNQSFVWVGSACYFLDRESKSSLRVNHSRRAFPFLLQKKEQTHMNRKERRALAHANSKTTTPPSVNTVEEPVTAPVKPQISEAQLAANRANAQLSTGATSEAGKKRVSQNALTTGLTGRQVLLPSEDGALYEAMVRDYQNHFLPVGPEEIALVQSIVDIRWRLDRYPGLESALLDLGRQTMLEIEPKLAGNPGPAFEMQIRSHLEKKFRNLELQENRLVRRRERETKELRELQAIRKVAEAQKTKEKPAEAGVKPNAVSAATSNGFVFSSSQVSNYVLGLTREDQKVFLREVLTTVASAVQAMEAAA